MIRNAFNNLEEDDEDKLGKLLIKGNQTDAKRELRINISDEKLEIFIETLIKAGLVQVMTDEDCD